MAGKVRAFAAVIGFILMGIGEILTAASVTLGWDPNTEPDLAGYKVYVRPAGGVYAPPIDVGNLTAAVVPGLTPGTPYSFVVTAYTNAGLESLPSNEVTVTPAAQPSIVLAPPSGAIGVAPATVGLAATVTPNGSTIVKVRFYSGSALLGEDSTAPYTFSWSNVAAGSYSLTAVAVYGASQTVNSPAVGLTVGPVPAVASIWPASAVPTNVDAGPDRPIVLGVKFRSDESGSITGIRFFKAATNGGIHVGTLWSGTGTPLATAQFANETAAGWQQVNFATPVTITANTVYVASYHCLGGHFSEDQTYFQTTGVDRPPLHALASGAAGGNGVYVYSSTNAFPTGEWKAANYWVDVAFKAASGASLNSIAVSPANPTLQKGAGLQLSATGSYSDGTTQNLTGMVAWTSSNVGVATVTASGMATGISTGAAVLSATLSGVTGTSTLSVLAPPSIVLTSPAPGGSYAAPATVTLAAAAAANGNTIAKVQFYNSATLLGEDTTAPYAYTWTNAPAGSHSLSARMVYGTNLTVNSAPVGITITNSLPAIALTGVASGATYTAPATLSLGAAVTPNGNTISKVQFYAGATLLGEDTTAPYSLTWTNAGLGSYSLVARVIHGAGLKVDSAAATVVIVNPPPAVVLNVPVGSGGFIAPTTINMTATVAANGNAITKVQFFADTALLSEDTSAPYGLALGIGAAGSFNFKARVIYGAAQSVDSAPVAVVVAGLPAPWKSADIGNPAVAGSAKESGGQFDVNGAGALGGVADGFRFVYQTLTGDGEMVGRVAAMPATPANGLFGLMIRESLTDASRFVFAGVGSDGLYRALWRDVTGGVAAGTTSIQATASARWVRLVRQGNVITGYRSTDGVAWTQINSRTIPMASNVQIGFAVASGNPSVLSPVSFVNSIVIP